MVAGMVVVAAVAGKAAVDRYPPGSKVDLVVEDPVVAPASAGGQAASDPVVGPVVREGVAIGNPVPRPVSAEGLVAENRAAVPASADDPVAALVPVLGHAQAAPELRRGQYSAPAPLVRPIHARPQVEKRDDRVACAEEPSATTDAVARLPALDRVAGRASPEPVALVRRPLGDRPSAPAPVPAAVPAALPACSVPRASADPAVALPAPTAVEAVAWAAAEAAAWAAVVEVVANHWCDATSRGV